MSFTNRYGKFRSLFLGNSNFIPNSETNIKDLILKRKYVYLVFAIFFLLINWKLFIALVLTIIFAIILNQSINKAKNDFKKYEQEYYSKSESILDDENEHKQDTQRSGYEKQS